MDEPSHEDNQVLLQQYFEALNERDRTAFKETMAEDDTFGNIEGPEEMAEMDWRWLEAMNLTWHIEEMYPAEASVTTRLRATGTHTGGMEG